MSLFTALEIDYTTKLKAVDVDNFTDEEKSIISSYRTPNRSYISSSSRDLSANDVDFDTLDYILSTCHQCKTRERYEAAIIALCKMAVDKQPYESIQEMKMKLIELIDATPTNSVVDFTHIQECTQNYEGSFFYLVELSIGTNKILKYGITDSQPRKRFAQIKSDIKSKYNKFAVSLKPLLVKHCENKEEFEDELKMLLAENDIFSSNYNFKGSTETIPKKYLEAVLSLINRTAESKSATILYIDDVIGQQSEPSKPFVATTQERRMPTLEKFYNDISTPVAVEQQQVDIDKTTDTEIMESTQVCSSCGNAFIDGNCGGRDCI